MRFAIALRLAISAGGLFFFASRAFADDTDPIEDAISNLLDPHAGSNEKIAAAHTLWAHAPDADSPDGRRVISALARQCHFDMEPVRVSAKQALIRMVGTREADRLIAAYVPENFDAFINDLRRVAQDWKAADFLDALASPRTEDRQRAIKSFAVLAVTEPKRLVSLDEPLKARLAGHLERFDCREPEMRRHTLILLEQIGPLRVGTVPVILRALADDDDREAQQIARRFSITDDKLPKLLAIVGALAVELVNPDRKIAAAAASLMPKDLSDSTKQFIARIVALAASHGDLEKIKILRLCDINPADITEAIYDQLSRATAQPIPLLKALRLAGLDSEFDDSPTVRDAMGRLLAYRDDNISVAAAALLTTPKSRNWGVDALVASIKQGQCPSLAMFKVFTPDPEYFGRQLIEPLKTGNPAVRRAAARVLAVIGVKDDAVRSALIPMLRNPDAVTRMAAAEAINTPEAHARARVPDLLSDVRSNSLSTRQLAARQFDELRIEPREVTAALIRAVESGDFAARQGLIAALELANSSGQNPLDVLNQIAAADNAAPRAYAKAALRQIQALKN